MPEWPAPIRVASTTSTNSDVASWAREGRPEGSALIAAGQTAGRGRLDRGWVSAPGDGVALSVLLRPHRGFDTWTWLPLLAGLAVRDAVCELKPVEVAAQVGLKWPNDVLISDAKVAGILLERVISPPSNGGDAAVVGVGINVTAAPSEVAAATSLSVHGWTSTADQVAVAVIASLHKRYGLWLANLDALTEDYRRSCVTLGRHVEVHRPDGSVLVGIAEGVDASGRLGVRERTSGVQSAPVWVSAGDIVHARHGGRDA